MCDVIPVEKNKNFFVLKREEKKKKKQKKRRSFYAHIIFPSFQEIKRVSERERKRARGSVKARMCIHI
jgi:hypothetical protein